MRRQVTTNVNRMRLELSIMIGSCCYVFGVRARVGRHGLLGGTSQCPANASYGQLTTFTSSPHKPASCALRLNMRPSAKVEGALTGSPSRQLLLRHARRDQYGIVHRRQRRRVGEVEVGDLVHAEAGVERGREHVDALAHHALPYHLRA
jgi:hypothetical protein